TKYSTHGPSPYPRAGGPGSSHTATGGHRDGPGGHVRVAYHRLNAFREDLWHATRPKAPLLVEKPKAITSALERINMNSRYSNDPTPRRQSRSLHRPECRPQRPVPPSPAHISPPPPAHGVTLECEEMISHLYQTIFPASLAATYGVDEGVRGLRLLLRVFLTHARQEGQLCFVFVPSTSWKWSQIGPFLLPAMVYLWRENS
ncbi:hypothetical protein B0H14DRAFT_2837363, partial [Mycena olivaceomarginata]